MKKTPCYIQLFNYVRFVWEGKDHRPSIKRILALIFSFDFVSNFQFAVRKWSEGKSMADLSSSLMIEAGLIAALLGMTAFFNLRERQLSQQNGESVTPGGVE